MHRCASCTLVCSSYPLALPTSQHAASLRLEQTPISHCYQYEKHAQSTCVVPFSCSELREQARRHGNHSTCVPPASRAVVLRVTLRIITISWFFFLIDVQHSYMINDAKNDNPKFVILQMGGDDEFTKVGLASRGEMLQGKWALITGASRGVGWTIAEKFAAEQANLILVARSKGDLEKASTAQLDAQNALPISTQTSTGASALHCMALVAELLPPCIAQLAGMLLRTRCTRLLRNFQFNRVFISRSTLCCSWRRS